MAKKGSQKKTPKKTSSKKTAIRKIALVKKTPLKKTPAKPAAKKAAPKKKPAPTKKAAPKKKATAVRKPPAKAPAKAKKLELDLSPFPAESVQSKTLGLCLACALDVLTRHMGLSPEKAMAEIRKYSPGLPELTAASPSRPYLELPADECPSCGAPPKWHAPLTIVKIEGGKAADTARRALVKTIGENPSFTIIEEKSTERQALYSWLSQIGASLDLDSTSWLMEAARHWLGRRLPKEDWGEVFQQVHFVRRSKRLTEDQFEVASPGLYLAPLLFDEILLIQYLLSRSHKAGGLTFEGRLTLQDLYHRLRGGGYLRRVGINAGNAADALEKLLEMQGGDERVKFHYIVDRRPLLSRLEAVRGVRVPRPKM